MKGTDDPSEERPPILFYYPFNRGFTGGPRTVVSLLAGLQEFVRPVFVTQRETRLTEVLRSEGIAPVIVPFPEILDVYDGAALRYSLSKKLRSIFALREYGARISSIARREGVVAAWGRGAKATLVLRGPARRLGIPLVWDIGIERQFRGWNRVITWTGLHAAARIVTQSRLQPREIFGPLSARLFADKFTPLLPAIEPSRMRALDRNRWTMDEDGRFRVLCVGTLHPRKNQLMLVEAIRALAERFPNLDADLVGPPGDEMYAKKLRSEVSRAGLEERIRFLGWREDVPELMGRSDLLVLCSHNEGVPHVIREAMYAGLPVAATAVGGVPEIVEDGITGFLIEPDDRQQLEGVLETCLRDRGELTTLSHRAREAAVQRFSHARWIADYAELLRDVVIKPGSE